ncbi:MAG: DUF4886 domain-containing protein, partial [Clostridia bacterium]|nr:DUF4886 domain-containing protein [Clostridia bacterium]
ATGPQGPTGATGPQGEAGSVWHTGFAVPLDSLGKDSDMYLDTTSKDIYQKVNGKWEPVGNMQGKEVKRKWDADNTLKILAIGNSFSDDALWLLPDVLKSLGITNFRISNLYIGGCTLQTHATNLETKAASYVFRTNTGNGWDRSDATGDTELLVGLLADDWDYISLQQGSPESGLASSYSYIPEIIDVVERYKPNAKILWHMTWAYQQNTDHWAFANYDKDQTKMYEQIVNSVKTQVLPNYDFHFIIPNGTAVQNARTSFLGDTLTRDGYHLTYDVGRYMAALGYAYLTTGYSIDNVAFTPAGMTSAIKAICVESIKNALQKPYTVTNSQSSIETNWVAMQDSAYGWNDIGYWNSTENGQHYQVIASGGISNAFVCTQMFTRQTLPVGSIIEIAAGYKYRPEGWVGTGVQSSRPENTTKNRIVVDEAWWGNYDRRAFNVSLVDGAALTDATAVAGAKAAFKIWLPK